jgi:hypothetical protein
VGPPIYSTVPNNQLDLATPGSRRSQGCICNATQNQRKKGETMTTNSTFTTTDAANLNNVMHGDCVEIMRQMQPPASTL